MGEILHSVAWSFAGLYSQATSNKPAGNRTIERTGAGAMVM